MDYLKIGKAEELSGGDYRLYRLLEILPGFLSWSTLLGLGVLAYFQPIFVAFVVIAFDVYWLLLVIFLGIHLLVAFRRLKNNSKKDWSKICMNLGKRTIKIKSGEEIIQKIISWDEIVHFVFYPFSFEDYDIVVHSIKKIVDSGYPLDKMIMVLAAEERAGKKAQDIANKVKQEYGSFFQHFVITTHPDNIAGEIKGKGSNQAWAAKIVKKEIIGSLDCDHDKILVSVFDMDTVIDKDYFYCLDYYFLTSPFPHRASYQPVPVYHNNIWQAPFLAGVAASSNTFWQMMQQIRREKLATYSSHSMTWRTLNEIGFWSTTMVSEDSRIFWHCFCHYRGDYRVVPLHYPVSMDVCMDKSVWRTAKNLYKQQRRWGWGIENVPYLIFNTIKMWRDIPKRRFMNRIFVQIYGFHSWATNAIIIGIIGWLPMIIGGDRFNATVLSTNLPQVTRTLMMLAMSGLILSAILSTMLLPKRPRKYGAIKYLIMLFQWLVLPLSIIIFGSIPGLDAQTRLIFKKYLGFWVTPKCRKA